MKQILEICLQQNRRLGIIIVVESHFELIDFTLINMYFQMVFILFYRHDPVDHVADILLAVEPCYPLFNNISIEADSRGKVESSQYIFIIIDRISRDVNF